MGDKQSTEDYKQYKEGWIKYQKSEYDLQEERKKEKKFREIFKKEMGFGIYDKKSFFKYFDKEKNKK